MRGSDRWWHHGWHELRWRGVWRDRHHVVDCWMLELLCGTMSRLKIGGHHREIVGRVVAGIVLPRYQVVPIHAFRDVVVIVFTAVCFTSLRRSTPITSAPSPGSITIITSRHGYTIDAQSSRYHLERHVSDNKQIHATARYQRIQQMASKRKHQW